MPTPPISADHIPDWLDLVRKKVEGLSYGVVQIVVHNHQVTQIERTEKTRLDALPPAPALRTRERDPSSGS